MRTEDVMTATAEPGTGAERAAVVRIGLRPHPALPWLLLPDGVPAQVLTESAVVKVPNSRDWFRGVVSQRGKLLPVFDLGEWAGHSPALGEGGRPPVIVVIGVGTDAFAVLSHRTPGLIRAERADASSDDGDGGGQLARYLGQAWRFSQGGEDSYAYPFDVRQWLGDIAHHITSTG